MATALTEQQRAVAVHAAASSMAVAAKAAAQAARGALKAACASLLSAFATGATVILGLLGAPTWATLLAGLVAGIGLALAVSAIALVTAAARLGGQSAAEADEAMRSLLRPREAQP
jgi:hypothetical protein